MHNPTVHRAMLALLLSAFVASTAAAQNASNCAQREVVIERLAGTFGETRQSIGLGANNTLVELFASQESGSWTITVTSASGVTCLVASGQAYEALAEALPAQGNDA